MYEKACSAVTALFFALFMALSVRGAFMHPLTTFGLCWKGCALPASGCCLVLALRRRLFPRWACLGLLWSLTAFSLPFPFALDDPDLPLVNLPRVFAGLFAAAVAYSVLYILAEKQRQAGTTGRGGKSGALIPLSLCLVVGVVGFDAFATLALWLAAPTRP